MTSSSLGKVAVTTSGTPVQLASKYTPCNRIRLSVVVSTLTGKCYLGTSALVISTLAGVIKEFLAELGGRCR